MLDTAITINSVLGIFGIIVAIVAGVTAVAKIINFINKAHDKIQQWDAYEATLKSTNTKVDTAHEYSTKALQEIQLETDAKLQEIKAEQCMLTYCMLATLDGLKQLGCNGKVTEARNSLDKYMNKQAHGQTNTAK